MRHRIFKTTLAVMLLGSTFMLNAAEVFTWRDQKGINEYSDAPQNLTPAKVQKFNVRTQTSTSLAPPPPMAITASDPNSIAAQQAEINRRIEEQNKQIIEKNKKIEDQNKKEREAACKAAQLNRKMADSMRTNHRDELIQRYDEEIRNKCK